MKIFQKVFTVLLIALYWYSQSVFSHLEIIESHHILGSIDNAEIHDSEYYQNTITQWCNNEECQDFCEAIEHAKITLTNTQTKLSIQHVACSTNDQNIFRYKVVPQNTDQLNYYPVWPPIAIAALLYRIWPIVRII